MPIIIRPYRAADRCAVYEICVRTGLDGDDARPMYRDHDLLPAVYAGPYLRLEPELAFVLDDGRRVVGYILGTADTATFVAGYRREWLPAMAARYPRRDAQPATPDEVMIAVLHRPDRMLRASVTGYPAHLHIDLLPEARCQGYGRALVDIFLGALRSAGVIGVHLGVARSNAPARAFYERVGFAELPATGPDDIVYLGRATSAS